MEEANSQQIRVIPSDEIISCGDHPIGQGGCGYVYKRKYNGHYVAVKYINKCHGTDAPDEARLLNKIHHNNVIKLLGYCPKPSALVLEYATDGSLHAAIMNQKFAYKLSRVIRWSMQCADALDAMHSMLPKPVIHRDIKPQNLLLFDNYRLLKIADFDCSRLFSTRMTSNRGTIAYMAPEILSFDDRKCLYTCKIDVYSFGVTLWQMVTRREPYGKLNQFQIYEQVLMKWRRPDAIDDCPLFKLMRECWHQNPNNRPDMSLVKTLLKGKQERQYVLISGRNGDVVILDSDTLEQVSARAEPVTCQGQIAVCNGMLYVIKDRIGEIYSTPASSLLTGNSICWQLCPIRLINPAFARGNVAVVGHVIYFMNMSYLNAFNTQTNTNELLRDFGEGMEFYSLCEADGNIYGYMDNKFKVTNGTNNWQTNEWRAIDILTSSKGHLRSSSLIRRNDNVCVVGGSNESGAVNSVLCYNTKYGSWSAISPLNQAREKAAIVSLTRNRSLIVGGWNGSEWLDTIEVFDETGKWTLISHKVKLKWPRAVTFYA